MNGIAGGLPIPGRAGNARMLPNVSTRRTLVHAVYRLCGNACAAEAQTSECENAVWRYGRNTARRQARSSSCAAMVRAWPRQCRNIPAPDPNAGGSNGHTQPSRCSRVQRPCPPLPARAGVFWLQNGFVLTPQFHYGDRNKGLRRIPCNIKGSVVREHVVWAENSRKRVLLPMGEVCLNAKIKTKRRSNIHEKPRHL